MSKCQTPFFGIIFVYDNCTYEKERYNLTMTKKTPSDIVRHVSKNDKDIARQISLAQLADESPAAAYVRTLNTDTGRRAMMQALTLAASILYPDNFPASKGAGRGGNAAQRFTVACAIPWAFLPIARLGELRAELIRRKYARQTVNQTLTAVRNVLRQVWLDNGITGDTLERSKLTLAGMREHDTEPVGRHVNGDELRRILLTCSKDLTPGGARDGAILALLIIGLRRMEVSNLTLADYTPADGGLRVVGKGNKTRKVYLTNGSRDAFEVWLNYRGNDDGNVFYSMNKGGKFEGYSITSQTVYNVCLERSAAAGCACKPHDLRRTFIGNTLSAGVDIVTVSRIVGHSNPKTTARYDRRPEETRRQAFEVLPIPYQREE